MKACRSRRIRHFLSRVEQQIEFSTSISDAVFVLANNLAVLVSAECYSDAIRDGLSLSNGCPISVEITNDRIGLRWASSVSERMEQTPSGPPCNFPFGQWKVAIKGLACQSTQPYNLDFLNELFSTLDEADYSDPQPEPQLLSNAENQAKRELADASKAFAPDAAFFGPLVRELDLLCQVSQRSTGCSSRWAWTAATLSDSFPPIYFYQSHHGQDSDERSPELLNPNGEEGILHTVLGLQTPTIVWNFQGNPRWRLSPTVKNRFSKLVSADSAPHLVYVPLNSRLAWQTTFSKEDFYRYVTYAREMQVNLHLALITAFQAAIYLQITEHGACQAGFFRAFQREADEASQFVRKICSRILLHYPLPILRIDSTTEPLPKFIAIDKRDHFSLLIEEAGSAAIRRAFDTLESHEQNRVFLTYGATQMGVFHTLKRPLSYLQDQLGKILNEEVNLSPHVVATLRSARRAIDSGKSFADLEIANFKDIQSFEGGQDLACAISDVFAVLQSAGYCEFPSCALALPIDFTISEPNFNKVVSLCLKTNFRYSIGRGSLALILAELIDNAAKYLENNPRLDQRIVATFQNNQISVVNAIFSPRVTKVSRKIEDGQQQVGKSLNRLFALAALLKCDLRWKIVDEQYVQFGLHTT